MAIGVLKTKRPVSVNGASLDSIEFDAVREEVHDSTARVTSHPVEGGSNKSDHVVVENPTITLQVTFSNGPLTKNGETGPRHKLVQRGFGKTVERVGTEGEVDPVRAETALEFVYTAHRERRAMTLTTTLRDYGDVYCTAVRTPRTAQVGDAIAATLTFERIEEASSTTGELPSAQKRTRGKKPPAPADADTTAKTEAVERSFLTQLLDAGIQTGGGVF